MMNDYATEAFMPHISVILITTVIAIMAIAFARGFFYVKPQNKTLEGVIGLAEFCIAVALADWVMMAEHYDGLVQTIINALRNNTDSSVAWADIFAAFVITIFGAVVGAGYLKIRKKAYRIRKSLRYSVEKM